jgi:hypothetical protein
VDGAFSAKREWRRDWGRGIGVAVGLKFSSCGATEYAKYSIIILTNESLYFYLHPHLE